MERSIPKLSVDIMNGLNAEVSIKEVRQALFSMAALKAPRVDGFHAKVFQANWNIVGKGVYNLV